MMLKNTIEGFKGILVGCDEAGRGCLSGPVVAAAVILPSGYQNAAIQDSKMLSESMRNALRIQIQRDAIAFGIGVCSALEIDEINILQASILAMHRALDVVGYDFDMILVDGNKFRPYRNIEHLCIVKGDQKYMQIAAASILAKTYRDEWMVKHHQLYPQYDWVHNKGYASPKHIQAIENFGNTPLHRKSFKLKKLQGSSDLFYNETSST